MVGNIHTKEAKLAKQRSVWCTEMFKRTIISITL